MNQQRCTVAVIVTKSATKEFVGLLAVRAVGEEKQGTSA